MNFQKKDKQNTTYRQQRFIRTDSISLDSCNYFFTTHVTLKINFSVLSKLNAIYVFPQQQEQFIATLLQNIVLFHIIHDPF